MFFGWWCNKETMENCLWSACADSTSLTGEALHHCIVSQNLVLGLLLWFLATHLEAIKVLIPFGLNGDFLTLGALVPTGVCHGKILTPAFLDRGNCLEVSGFSCPAEILSGVALNKFSSRPSQDVSEKFELSRFCIYADTKAGFIQQIFPILLGRLSICCQSS